MRSWMHARIQGSGAQAPRADLAGTVTRVDALDVSDEELEALALSGEVDAPLPVDAQPLPLSGAAGTPLPPWYMPAAVAGTDGVSTRRRVVVWSVVLAFIAIDAVGMCSTYGHVGFG
jgi:hypothetical protein